SYRRDQFLFAYAYSQPLGPLTQLVFLFNADSIAIGITSHCFIVGHIGAPQVSSDSLGRQGIRLLVWCFRRRGRRRVIHAVPVTRRPNKTLTKSRNSLVSGRGGRDI